MKPKPTTPTGAGTAAAPTDQPTYRNNPEVDAKIDAYIKENPRFWAHVQQMPRERLERTVVLHEVNAIERRQRMQEGTLKRISADPELKAAYDRIVKDLPEDQRDAVLQRLVRQNQRTIAQTQGAKRAEGVGV